jgi:lipoprotein-releasing system permease protein
MKIESFISKRYLLSKHKINFITIISVLSILGITIGVASLIIILSVFNGFGSLVTSFLMNFDPNLRVEIISDGGFQYTNQLKNDLQKNKEVKDFSPYVEGKVLAYRGNLTRVVNLKGIVKDSIDFYNISPSMQLGKFILNPINNSLPGIILGLPLADHLQVLMGDTLTLISPAGIENVITQFSQPNMQKFIVRGIYVSNNNEYDDNFIFTNMKTAQDLLGYGSRIQGYDVMLNNIDNSNKVKESLETELNPKLFSVNTWYDFHSELYYVMKVERWSAFLILSLIIAVACFNVLGSLSMSVIEKKRDIGILRSMGLKETSIIRIFMYEGLMIGLIGTIAGLFIGYFVCWLQIHFNIYPLDPTQYKVDSLPVQIRISDFFFISIASMFLSFIASYFPAKRAGKVDPLEAIKWE